PQTRNCANGYTTTATRGGGWRRMTRSLLPQHLQDLQRSGLSSETIRTAHLYSETDAERIAELLGWEGGTDRLGAALVFPLLDAEGKANGVFQLKPDQPLTADNGKPRKYETPKGMSPTRLYVPPTVRVALADATADLLITEGAKKALSASQN